MKKKFYYMFYILCQFCFGVYGYLNSDILAKEQIEVLDLEEFSYETVLLSCKVSMLVSILISILLFYLVLKKNKLERNKLVIFLIFSSIFFSSGIVAFLAIISLILILMEPKEKKKKKERKLPHISNLESTRKDYIAGIILIFVYFSQIYIVPFISSIFNSQIISTVFYELFIICTAIWAFFERYKRDFKYLKQNFFSYFKSALKYWGLMYLCVFFVAAIQVSLGVSEQSTNQNLLETLPLWYLVPSAVIFAPVVEEAIFRGVFRRFIKNDLLFVIISGVSFGLLHTLFSEETLYMAIVQSLNYVAMGIVLSYSYVKSNNIFMPMLVHMIQNTIGVLVIILGM